jgi:hypothetical protein
MIESIFSNVLEQQYKQNDDSNDEERKNVIL